ncbi:exodeoxyribonuclease V subunit alpha [Halomonas vilamensis]|uniref:RecBCD enzyme subunit RecD n=1 Tax=Vreelandella vilamensis TaxID=531309 RepID=A0ABU1H8J1_9GAMM|nr:exodeoxyribonuclease V subunit alpha [Halomonas vilamensis]MDR5900032.1 exodeoxyribonuclease V subunit alpha [Halomonas vilamensis]
MSRKRTNGHPGDTHTFDLFDDTAAEMREQREQREPSEPTPTAATEQVSAYLALSDTAELLALCERWVARGWLRDLDRALVRFFAMEAPDAPPLLLLGAALASHQLGRGHVCLDLNATLSAPDFALSLPPEGDDLTDPPPLPSQVLAPLTLADWQAALNHPLLASDGPGNTPLVVSNNGNTTKLYLRRYWQYEQTLHQEIAHRLEAMNADGESALLPDALTILFDNTGTLDWQKTACALAARNRFGIITGGPGTGKTTTVVRLLALLQTLQLAAPDDQPLRIRLAAPTGKAAARLNESIAGQVNNLPIDQLEQLLTNRVMSEDETRRSATKTRSLHPVNKQFEERFNTVSSSAIAIPTEVTTLHRLLGAHPDTRHFRHNAANPLALDVLVIDEASMVDIEMMTAVLRALPAQAQLVLLGDKDQLASVEAGAVLGDLCRRAEAAHYTPETAQWLEHATGQPLPPDYIDAQGQPLDQAITMLRVSHRFNEHSGIGQLAQAINQPSHNHRPEEKHQAVNQVLRHGYPDLHHLTLTDDAALDKLVIHGSPDKFINGGEGRTDHNGAPIAPPTGYRHYLNVLNAQRPRGESFEESADAYNDWADALLSAYSHFQLLCALRKGPWGVEGLNLRIAKTLRHEKLLYGSDFTLEKGWYEGRPVLVTQNDYGLKLMNGDIGITLAVPDPRTPGKTLLRVAFPTSDPEKPIRWVLPSRLHAVETVFAMTVHKSQGSEFKHTALLLPPTINPILTRELVYTGITRARDWLTLIEAKRGVMNEAVTREVMRVSGLEGI